MNGKSQRERAFVFVAAGASSADSASRSKSTRVMYNQIQFPQLQKKREGENVNATGEYNQFFYPKKKSNTAERQSKNRERVFSLFPKYFLSLYMMILRKSHQSRRFHDPFPRPVCCYIYLILHQLVG